MANIKQHESLKVTGTIKVNVYRAGYAEIVAPLFQTLKLLRKSNDLIELRRIEQAIRKVQSQFFVRTAVECPNTVMDSPNYGIDLLIQWLTGQGTYANSLMSLDYIEIGTGSTTPTISDTALNAPTNRAAVGFQQDYATTDAIVQAIFSDSQLANGTYYEMGTFCGGTTTIGTGQLFNHALFATPYTKASGTDTTIEADFNFS